jgi:acyl carrier protein
MTDVRTTVYSQAKTIATQQKKHLPPLTDDLVMLDSGLDSLCMAVLVATLDDKLHVTPFDDDDVEIPVTFGDLIRVYETATNAKITTVAK